MGDFEKQTSVPVAAPIFLPMSWQPVDLSPRTKAVVDCGEISFPLERIICCIYRQGGKTPAAGVSWAFPFTKGSKVGCGAGKEPSLRPDVVLSQKRPLQIERGWKTGSLRHRRSHLGDENPGQGDEDKNIFQDFP